MMVLTDKNYKDLEVDSQIFEGSSRILLLGGSHCGKTYFLQNLVLRHEKKIKKIILCGTPNDLLEYPQTKGKTVRHEGIYDPFEEAAEDLQEDDDRQILVVYDDLMSEAYNSQIISRLFSRGRHYRISTVLVLQSYFPSGSGRSVLPMVKNNASHQIFFKLRNQAEMCMVAKKLEFDKRKVQFFTDLIQREVYGKKYGYVAVYMDESNPEARYRNNLVGEDGSPHETVYTCK